MIQLPLRREGDLLVANDAIVPGRVHVIGGPPRVALDPGGRPRLRLLRWPPGDAGPAGHLTVDITTAPTAEAAGERPAGDHQIVWEDATVSLSGAGVDVTNQAVLGGGPFGVLSCPLDLPSAGAIEEHLADGGVGLLRAAWLGHVRARLPEVEVVAAIDRSEVTQRLVDVSGPRKHEITASIVRAAVRLEVRGGPDDALAESLTDWAARELARRLETGEDLQVRLTGADVISLPIHLVGTLAPVPTDAPGLVTHLDTPPGAGPERHTRVVVLADWSTTDHVTLEVDPDDAGSDDTTVMTIQDDTPRQLDLATRASRWRVRSTIGGHQHPWTTWTSSTPTLALTVPVAPPTDRRVEVVAAGLDWDDRWQRVEVFLRREHGREGDPRAGREEVSDEGGLGAGAPPDAVLTREQRRISLVVDDDTETTATTLFWARCGTSFPGSPVAATSGQLVVADPLRDVVERTIVPTGGGWAEVLHAMVDLAHVDGDNRSTSTVPLDPGTPLAAWQTPARVGRPGTVSWRLHASMVDGRLVQTDWAESTDPVVAVDLAGGSFVEVQVVVAGLGAAGAERVTVEVGVGDATDVVEASEAGVHVLRLPAGPVDYASRWHGLDGTTTVGPSGTTQGDTIVVASPQP